MSDISSRIRNLGKSREQREIEYLGSRFEEDVNSFLSKFASKLAIAEKKISMVLDEVETSYGTGAFSVIGLKGPRNLDIPSENSMRWFELMEKGIIDDIPHELTPEFIEQQISAIRHSTKIIQKCNLCVGILKRIKDRSELTEYREEFDPLLLPHGQSERFVYRSIYFIFEGNILKRVRVMPAGLDSGKVFSIQFTDTYNALRNFLAQVIYRMNDISVSAQEINPKKICNILCIKTPDLKIDLETKKWF